MILLNSKMGRRLALLLTLIASATIYGGVYVPWRIRKAEREIRKFCDGVAIGDRPGPTLGKAQEAGLRAFRPGTGKEWRHSASAVSGSKVLDLSIVVVDGWSFARWFCELDLDPTVGDVASKKVFSLN